MNAVTVPVTIGGATLTLSPPKTQIVTSIIIPSAPSSPPQTVQVVLTSVISIVTPSQATASVVLVLPSSGVAATASLRASGVSASAVASSTPVTPTSNTTVIYAPNPGLSTGAKAGIGVGVTFGVLIIAVIAFLLGTRARRKSAHPMASRTRRHDATWESKPELHGHSRAELGGKFRAELDGQGRPTPELEGRGIARWWSRRFSRNRSTVRHLNEAEPQELPAENVKAPKPMGKT